MNSNDDRVEVGQLDRHIHVPDGKEEQEQQKYNCCRLFVTDVYFIYVAASDVESGHDR